MKDSNIKKIIEAAKSNETVEIGDYTYKADLDTGEILRCLTSDVGRVWLDRHTGKYLPSWKVIAKV